MSDNITVLDGDGFPVFMRTKETAGVHTPVHRIEGYDPVDDMVKMKSIQKKFRDSFTSPLTDKWDVTNSGGSTTATISGGILTIASGTTAGSWVELLSKETFTIPCRIMAAVNSGATRQANTHHYLELVSVDSVTGLPDERHRVAIDIGGAASTTVTHMDTEVQNGGLAPLVGDNQTITTTNGFSIIELEPFSDEAYFHSRALDNATVGRSHSYVRQQQIPDANALYKIRVRSMNHAAWKAVTGAVGVGGAGTAIQITSAAHGYTNGATVWVECLNGVTNSGAAVRGNYTIQNVTTNTFELVGTTFGGAYVTGSGRVALAAAPTNINYQLQFINCQDYAELTAEITAGRGGIAAGQAIPVIVVTAPTTTVTGTVTANEGTLVNPSVLFRSSTADTNLVSVKGTAGTLYGVSVNNTNAAARYLKIYNKASAPVLATDIPVLVIPIPAGGTATQDFSVGLRFSLGIAMALTTGAADTDTGAVAAGEHKVALSYI